MTARPIRAVHDRQLSGCLFQLQPEVAHGLRHGAFTRGPDQWNAGPMPAIESTEMKAQEQCQSSAKRPFNSCDKSTLLTLAV